MQHYEIGEWVDFTRNLLSERQRNNMEQHLASGCTECGATLEFLQKVGQAAAAESACEAVTRNLAASARQVFKGSGARSMDRVVEALQLLVANLTYDSASDLLPQGARAHRAATRQMMFQAGDFCLDLCVDRELDSSRVTLLGQLANAKDPRIQMAQCPVLILAGDKILTQTASNEFGEFSLEYVPRPNLLLCVPIDDAGVRVEVPLKRLLEEHDG
jgi:predicted nucleic acid-binding Zn ribbon protein